jgi:hypothetical protein
MALLTATRPTAAGTLWSPAAVAASDTISASDLGSLGAILIVINGNASPDNVTVSDSSLSPGGNPATASAVAVANATTRAIYISPRKVNPSTSLVTVTHSVTATVTCVLIPLG